MYHLSNEEEAILATCPKPPKIGLARTNRVVVIECLASEERRNGLELVEWMNSKLSGIAQYFACRNVDDLKASLAQIREEMSRTGDSPIIHLEAHGHIEGIVWSGEDVGPAISWEELAKILRPINEMSKCNLILVVSACLGIAALNTMSVGPRVAAIAVVGPCGEATPKQLLEGFKEFYRRLWSNEEMLQDFADSATQEVGAVEFAVQPFTSLAYESFMNILMAKTRPWRVTKQEARPSRRRARKIGAALQELWDRMYMIDLYPENQERFGLDVKFIVSKVTS